MNQFSIINKKLKVYVKFGLRLKFISILKQRVKKS